MVDEQKVLVMTSLMSTAANLPFWEASHVGYAHEKNEKNLPN